MVTEMTDKDGNEIFFLMYYLHFNFSDARNMTSEVRQWFINKFNTVKEAEMKEVNFAKRKK